LRVELSYPSTRFRRWQRHVLDHLGALPSLRVTAAPVVAGLDAIAGLDLLFAFERIFVAADAETAVDPLPPPPPRDDDGTGPDLVLDLTGTRGPDPRAPTLRTTCLGLPPLLGALAAVLDGRAPTLELDLIEPSGAVRRLACWRIGIEDRHNTLLAVSQVLGRLAHMAIVGVEDRMRGLPDGGRAVLAAETAPAPNALATTPRLLARAISSRVRRRLERRLRTPPDWRVIWRTRAPATAPLAPEHDPTPFRLLPDDGGRFYADPFVWSHGGRSWLFVEEFPYATGRGVLSVAEIAADGTIARPRPFLEQSCHLSYPQVFAEAGEIWMVPETSGRRTVELWRAVAFPDRWERHAVLLDDVDVGDATLVRRDGLWWMFGCRREPWCSSWDALHVWCAADLVGPWRPIAPAPAKVDVASARPAGAMVATPEGLFRPVQDSQRRYGHGLALARVDRLEEGAFAETIVKRFATPPPLLGLHTWNRAATRAGLVEVMDVFARPEAFGSARVLDLMPEATAGAAIS
jgi:hypothetical protein